MNEPGHGHPTQNELMSVCLPGIWKSAMPDNLCWPLAPEQWKDRLSSSRWLSAGEGAAGLLRAEPATRETGRQRPWIVGPVVLPSLAAPPALGSYNRVLGCSKFLFRTRSRVALIFSRKPLTDQKVCLSATFCHLNAISKFCLCGSSSLKCDSGDLVNRVWRLASSHLELACLKSKQREMAILK